ncbi:MAG: molybdopterin converting factor small subunit [Planctomycetota bacterium]
MKITLEFTAQLRELAGVSRLEAQVPNACCVRVGLESALKSGSEELRTAILPAGQLAAALILAVDDSQVDLDDPAPLRDGAQLLVLSPIAGG